MINKRQAIFADTGRTYTYGDILCALQKVGIQSGDTLFVHADLKSFGKVIAGLDRKTFIEAFIAALQECIGQSGNLIMPTFTYSFCKKEVFDPQATPSAVGILSEQFRALPGVMRSNDPIFSVSAWGADKNFFADVGPDCFGVNSVFEKLYDRDAKIIFLGDTFDITYIHFVEQHFGVPYRFIKHFTGVIKTKERLRECTVSYNVRPLDKNIEYDLERIAKYLNLKKVLKAVPLGYSKIRCVGAVDAFKAITQGLTEDIYIFLKDRPVYAA